MITSAQFRPIEHRLPEQRGNIKLPYQQAITDVLAIAERACKWHGVPDQLDRCQRDLP